jgi:galactoside O-acetyltransferase
MGLGIRTALHNLGRKWRSHFARQFLVVSIGPDCDLRPGCVIEGGKPAPGQRHKGISLGKGVIICAGAVLTTDAYTGTCGITIGDGSWVNRNSLIYGGGGVTIGKDVLIAPGVVIWSGGHRFDNPSGPVKGQELSFEPIKIDDGAWIGAGSIILQGVTIGAGAVIGAGSVVTKDIPSNAIAVGNPANVIKFRGQ